MIEEGILSEIYSFMKAAKNFGDNYEFLPVPIGYSEGIKTIRDLIQYKDNEKKTQGEMVSFIRKLILDYCKKFQTNSR